MSHARYALSDDEEGGMHADQAGNADLSRVKPEAALPPMPQVELDLGLDTQEDTAQEEPHILRLAHAWLNERGAPEILAWDFNIVEKVMDQILQQQSILDSLASDASTSEEEHFRLNLVQLDVERAKWLLRSYLRSRLVKIEKYAAYIMEHRTEQARLSDVELGYAKRYHQLMHDHYTNAVLQFLPETMRSMQDAVPGSAPESRAGKMAASPNLDTPVFIYCREDCGPLRVFELDGAPAALDKGSIHLLAYRSIRLLLQQRRVELL
ncbi:GINS complex subunit [Malassezia vespertilionis]|uniref:DNA replication complex GINS protein SLD5 n=1 Tax=Malassezia vespertilionis TaxID=2020962 RepID=A0A2N1JEM1_9BASI|nr:GINS complex subunit [Malassezia vespertilionis]PKI85000.1 Sld5p [Malassezia vespertilionis]WFD05742.1 GINS complex subunit [Malassezia vespertilionis]